MDIQTANVITALKSCGPFGAAWPVMVLESLSDTPTCFAAYGPGLYDLQSRWQLRL